MTISSSLTPRSAEAGVPPTTNAAHSAAMISLRIAISPCPAGVVAIRSLRSLVARP
jgi:hypothetical protein